MSDTQSKHSHSSGSKRHSKLKHSRRRKYTARRLPKSKRKSTVFDWLRLPKSKGVAETVTNKIASNNENSAEKVVNNARSGVSRRSKLRTRRMNQILPTIVEAGETPYRKQQKPKIIDQTFKPPTSTTSRGLPPVKPPLPSSQQQYKFPTLVPPPSIEQQQSHGTSEPSDNESVSTTKSQGRKNISWPDFIELISSRERYHRERVRRRRHRKKKKRKKPPVPAPNDEEIVPLTDEMQRLSPFHDDNDNESIETEKLLKFLNETCTISNNDELSISDDYAHILQSPLPMSPSIVVEHNNKQDDHDHDNDANIKAPTHSTLSQLLFNQSVNQKESTNQLLNNNDDVLVDECVNEISNELVQVSPPPIDINENDHIADTNIQAPTHSLPSSTSSPSSSHSLLLIQFPNQLVKHVTTQTVNELINESVGEVSSAMVSDMKAQQQQQQHTTDNMKAPTHSLSSPLQFNQSVNQKESTNQLLNNDNVLVDECVDEISNELVQPLSSPPPPPTPLPVDSNENEQHEAKTKNIPSPPPPPPPPTHSSPSSSSHSSSASRLFNLLVDKLVNHSANQLLNMMMNESIDELSNELVQQLNAKDEHHVSDTNIHAAPTHSSTSSSSQPLLLNRFVDQLVKHSTNQILDDLINQSIDEISNELPVPHNDNIQAILHSSHIETKSQYHDGNSDSIVTNTEVLNITSPSNESSRPMNVINESKDEQPPLNDQMINENNAINTIEMPSPPPPQQQQFSIPSYHSSMKQQTDENASDMEIATQFKRVFSTSTSDYNDMQQQTNRPTRKRKNPPRHEKHRQPQKKRKLNVKQRSKKRKRATHMMMMKQLKKRQRYPSFPISSLYRLWKIS